MHQPFDNKVKKLKMTPHSHFLCKPLLGKVDSVQPKERIFKKTKTIKLTSDKNLEEIFSSAKKVSRFDEDKEIKNINIHIAPVDRGHILYASSNQLSYNLLQNSNNKKEIHEEDEKDPYILNNQVQNAPYQINKDNEEYFHKYNTFNQKSSYEFNEEMPFQNNNLIQENPYQYDNNPIQENPYQYNNNLNEQIPYQNNQNENLIIKEQPDSELENIKEEEEIIKKKVINYEEEYQKIMNEVNNFYNLLLTLYSKRLQD